MKEMSWLIMRQLVLAHQINSYLMLPVHTAVGKVAAKMQCWLPAAYVR